MSASPTVSVVIATYNRGSVLRHAVRSVVDSSFEDWELIVAGDACTDDTQDCVASFGDSRIRFVNLAKRCGDQSGPNNCGVALARGRFVAFLNHDDLYLKDHLALCVEGIETSGADLVWVPCAVALPASDSPAGGRSRFTLTGAPSGDSFSPFAFYGASTWLFRRGLASRVGPWRAPDKLYVTPSQDWIFRAWRSGAKLRFLPRVTVIAVPAGPRKGCYADAASPDHDFIVQSLREDPRFLERVFEEAAVEAAQQRTKSHFHSTLRGARRLLLAPVYASLIAAGIHPGSLPTALLHAGRGGLVRAHRKTTGAG